MTSPYFKFAKEMQERVLTTSPPSLVASPTSSQQVPFLLIIFLYEHLAEDTVFIRITSSSPLPIEPQNVIQSSTASSSHSRSHGIRKGNSYGPEAQGEGH